MVAQIERALPQLHGKMPRGIVQVYTASQRLFYGDVMASAFQRAGQGAVVLIVQFFQGGIGQGIHAPRRFVENLQWVRCDLHRFIKIDQPELSDQEKQAVLDLWQCSKEALLYGTHNLIVLDELSLAVDFKILTEAEVIDSIVDRAPSVEVVLTGMNIPASFLEIADQVTQKRVSYSN